MVAQTFKLMAGKLAEKHQTEAAEATTAAAGSEEWEAECEQ